MEFGELLRNYRKERGLSLRALGSLTGLSYSYLGYIEKFKKNVPRKDIRILSIALGLDGAKKRGFYKQALLGIKDEIKNSAS